MRSVAVQVVVMAAGPPMCTCLPVSGAPMCTRVPVPRLPTCTRVPVPVRVCFPVSGLLICVACSLPFKDHQAASPGHSGWGSPRALGKWGWGRRSCATLCCRLGIRGVPARRASASGLSTSPLTHPGQQGRLCSSCGLQTCPGHGGARSKGPGGETMRAAGPRRAGRGWARGAGLRRVARAGCRAPEGP